MALAHLMPVSAKSGLSLEKVLNEFTVDRELQAT